MQQVNLEHNSTNRDIKRPAPRVGFFVFIVKLLKMIYRYMKVKYKIKKEYLDQKVSSPQNGRPITLRYVEESLYPLFYLSFPWCFENVKIEDDLSKSKSK